MDYLKVEPDYYALLTRSFTPGRGGRKITGVVRHHMAGALTGPQLKNLWENSRAASAHYGVEPSGRIVQLVNDRDTAWANANTVANQTMISIEHANSGGAAQDWPISDTVIIAGARWAAALCLFYGLGRPVYGKNIFDHRDFGQTGCPMHLANGGKYHRRWMDEAQRFYDELAARKAGKPVPAKPAPNPVPAKPVPRPTSSSVEDLANAVLRGDYGTGQTRKAKLGSNYDNVQRRVNDIFAGRGVTDANIDALARGVLRRAYGDGDARRRHLGALYGRVQARVNQLAR